MLDARQRTGCGAPAPTSFNKDGIYTSRARLQEIIPIFNSYLFFNPPKQQPLRPFPAIQRAFKPRVPQRSRHTLLYGVPEPEIGFTQPPLFKHDLGQLPAVQRLGTVFKRVEDDTRHLAFECGVAWRQGLRAYIRKVNVRIEQAYGVIHVVQVNDCLP